MTIEKLSMRSLQLDEVSIGERLRPVTAAGVAQLIASIGAIGYMTDPIQVRQIYTSKAEKARLVLMAGAHRLAAASELGWTEIQAQIWRCNDGEARLFEIDDNLASRELSALERAVFMAARKRIYLELHPETAKGVAGGKARKNQQPESIPFVESTAQQFGKSASWAMKYVAIGERLRAEDIAAARAAGIDASFTDLMQLAKRPPEDRARLLGALGDGIKTIAAAERKLRGAPKLPDGEKKLRRALDAWHRLGKREKRKMIALIAEQEPDLVKGLAREGDDG